MPALEPDFDKIPEQFRKQRRWILWTEEMVAGRLTKVPRQANGAHAKTNMPTTWATFDRVKAAYKTGKFSGIGYCRADDEVFIDLDACFDEHGNWRRWAWSGPQPEEIYNALKAYGYAEKSPSTLGLHMILRASELPATLKVPIKGDPHSGYECYPSTARFLTVTGAEVSMGDLSLDAGAAIAEVNARVIAAHEEQSRSAKATNGAKAEEQRKNTGNPTEDLGNLGNPMGNSNLPDDELIQKACRDATFAALWYGGAWEGLFGSQSEADLWLCQRLAFWTGCNTPRIDSFYRRSGLYRLEGREDKWDSSRPGGTYGSITIEKAISITSDTYSPKPRGRPAGSTKKAKTTSAGSGETRAEANAGGDPGGEGESSGEGTPDPPDDASAQFASAHDIPADSDLFGHAWTDVGNAERFRARFGENLRYTAPLKTWFHWGPAPYWHPDATGYAHQLGIAQAQALTRDAETAGHRALVKYSLQSQSAGKINAMLEIARSLDGIAIDVEDLDRYPWLLNHQSGTFEFDREGKRAPLLREHRREDYLTHIVPANYRPGAKHQAWSDFIESSQPDPEIRRYLQKAAGYTLTGSTREEIAFLMVGAGRNGKGTFLHVMQTLLGPLATTASFETFLLSRKDQSTELATFRGRRMVVAQEAGTRATFNEAILKSLTGGDRIKAKALYANPFEYQPQFKLWLAVNHAPDVRDASPGFWSRIRVIPWLVDFSGRENKNLKHELTQPEALEAFFFWCVEGLEIWQQEGMGTPAAVAAATAEYREETDSVRLWIDERCEEHMNLSVQSSVAYSDYSEFSRSQNIFPATREGFRNSLETKGFASKKSNVFYFMGLALKHGKSQA